MRTTPLNVEACVALVTSRHWTTYTERSGDCIVWVRTKDQHGYGMVSLEGKNRRAHRVAWVGTHGQDIPEGLTLDHLCRNRACVNPEHLEPVTHRENILRGENHVAVRAAMTHCPKGHPLSGDNLDRWNAEQGKRRCRACVNENARNYRARKAVSA